MAVSQVIQKQFRVSSFKFRVKQEQPQDSSPTAQNDKKQFRVASFQFQVSNARARSFHNPKPETRNLKLSSGGWL